MEDKREKRTLGLFMVGCAFVFVRQADAEALKKYADGMTDDNPFRRLIRAALEFRHSLTTAEVEEIEQTDFMQLVLELHEKFWLSADKATEEVDVG